MSQLALDLIELTRIAQGDAGTLTLHLLKEVAARLISEGVRDAREGL